MKKISLLLAATALTSQVVMADDDHKDDSDHRMSMFKVTVTNASANQVLTPPLVIAHKRGYQVFSIGDAASYGLAHQAENGDPSLLKAEADADMKVLGTATGTDLLHPGESAEILIDAPRNARFSVTSMLAISNDAFAAVQDISSKNHRMALVYDAGSEYNSEECLYIPACGPNEHDNTRDAEGIVTLHSGVHGGADLVPAMADWRGPVASVSVKRMHNNR